MVLCAAQVERAHVVTRAGVSVPLEANLDGTPAAAATFAPAHLERMILTRASASNMERRQRAIQASGTLQPPRWHAGFKTFDRVHMHGVQLYHGKLSHQQPQFSSRHAGAWNAGAAPGIA